MGNKSYTFRFSLWDADNWWEHGMGRGEDVERKELGY